MFRKSKADASPQVEQAVRKAVNYEVSIADLARRSERRAWMVAFFSLVVSVALAGGYYYMLPLKEKVPFLVMADAYTGTATVARLSGEFPNRDISVSEAINRSNVAQYVLARESYDWDITALRDWNTVFVMSEPNVSAEYRELYSAGNPDNPGRVYGRNRAIRVKILSMTPLREGPGGGFRGAAVRIQRSIYDKSKATSELLDMKYVTLQFAYRKDLKLDEQQRVLNPLGFRVTGYRVDSDYGQAVAVPDQTATLQAPSTPVAPAMAPVAEDAADPAMPAIGAGVPGARAADAASAPISIGTADGANKR